MNDVTDIINNAAKAIEAKAVSALNAELVPEFDDLLELRNLKGENTGYTKIYRGDGPSKISSMSIDIKPGMARYFNLQIVPDASLKLPRYVYEGMAMGHASQVSVDLYPDMDMISNLDWIMKKYEGISEYFNTLRKEKPEFGFCVSRTIHMRTFASPVFLLAPKISAEMLPDFESMAEWYFDYWLKMFSIAETSDEAETEARRQRRKIISDQTIALDPDRKMVTGVYGEELTERIEEGAMYHAL